MRSKNSNAEIQTFLYHLRLAAKSFAETDAGLKIKDLMSDRVALEKGKDFVLLVVTSSKFREMLIEIGQIVSKLYSIE